MSNKLYFLLITLFLLSGCSKKENGPTPITSALSLEKAITNFKFLKSVNGQLDKDYSGIISGNTIAIELPYGIDKTNLIATFQSSNKATVSIGATQQISGQTANNFTLPITYTVTAEDKSVASYQITIQGLGIAPNTNLNQTTSYHYRTNATLWLDYNKDLPSALKFYNGGYLARAIYDFDKDGDEDIIMGNLNFDESNGQLLNSPRKINYIQNNGGSFADNTAATFTGEIPGQVHPRKAFVGDFDKNGWMDVVFAGHGFDAPPFPGEKALIMMNNNGKFNPSYLSQIGYYHSGCSGDIDNDGDLDIFFTDNKNQCKFFINNGSGQFTYDATIFPSEIVNLNYFTSELYDLNNDGYLELIITGHEHEGANPTVFWGSYTGKYTKSNSSALPKIAGWGVAIDINMLDINGDGLLDIILNRQGDGTASQKVFHGINVQIMLQQTDKSFKDVSSTSIQGNPIVSSPTTDWFWVDWLRVFDYDKDGKKDIVTENKNFNIVWKNSNSVFIKQ